MDGRTITVFMKLLNELKQDVLNKDHKLSPDSFLIFLDKMSELTPSEALNEMIISQLERVDIN